MPQVHIAVTQSPWQNAGAESLGGFPRAVWGEVQLPGRGGDTSAQVVVEGLQSGCASRWLYVGICAVFCVFPSV